MKSMAQRLERVAFYARNALRQCIPDRFYRQQLPGLLQQAQERQQHDPAFASRLEACCRMLAASEPSASALRLKAIPSHEKHTYYYDFRAIARYFPDDLQVDYIFGDVTTVPPQPAFVKSRPIQADNDNAVLLRLNQVRHFDLIDRDQPFASKIGRVVWRGRCGANPLRQRLVDLYHHHPLCDIGDISQRRVGTPQHRPHMTVRRQLDFRYIISLEGIDVASNLKWIMSSQSLCLMPRPRFETWFLESTLVPGRHYVLLSDDFADLEDLIQHYERHPAEAESIVAAANAYVAPFRDRRSELLLSLLVMQRYFIRTGQLPASQSRSAL